MQIYIIPNTCNVILRAIAVISIDDDHEVTTCTAIDGRGTLQLKVHKVKGDGVSTSHLDGPLASNTVGVLGGPVRAGEGAVWTLEVAATALSRR